jgi:cytochrome c peroxidase
MFSYYYKAIAALSVAGVAVVSFFTSSHNPSYETLSVIDNYASEFNTAVNGLDATANGFLTGKVSVDSLQHTLAVTREKYKKIEFYLAFHHTEYVNDHINGAPLMQIEREGTRPSVIEPEGLQVLDEMVFSDNPAEEKQNIAGMAKSLRSNYNLLYSSFTSRKVKSGLQTAAMRLELVRILSLGITGFDTPGSLNALPETKAALQGMREYFKESAPQGETTNNILSVFDGAIATLNKNVSFDDFDRMVFIKNYLDPLYKALGTMKGEDSSQLLAYASPWNSKSQSIFAADFLNPYFFTRLTKEEDSKELHDLGKSLFYDPVLSNDNGMSCASCHNPDKGFTDAQPKSLSSVQGKTVLRNAPTLLNAVYADRYFYDLRAYTLEQQAEHVIFNPSEFNTAYSSILKKLNNNPEYAKKFKSVFGSGDINRENFSKALASYVLSLSSFNSEFDKYVRGEDTKMSDEAKRGFNLFMGKAACATCHFAPTFAGLVPPFYNENESEILGVMQNPKDPSSKIDEDSGRLTNGIGIEQAWIYEKSFKTSTVRNAGITAPYFHNGAYATLEEVIEFYNLGGGEGMGRTVKNQTLAPDVLNLTPAEQKDLIAFIKTLTDDSVTKK